MCSFRSESVDEPAHSVISHGKKRQASQNNKKSHVRAFMRSLFFLHREKEKSGICHVFLQNGPAYFASSRNFAAVIWKRHVSRTRKTKEKQRKGAAPGRLQRRREHMWTHNDDENNAIMIIIIMTTMHSAAGYKDWFTPTMSVARRTTLQTNCTRVRPWRFRCAPEPDRCVTLVQTNRTHGQSLFGPTETVPVGKRSEWAAVWCEFSAQRLPRIVFWRPAWSRTWVCVITFWLWFIY